MSCLRVATTGGDCGDDQSLSNITGPQNVWTDGYIINPVWSSMVWSGLSAALRTSPLQTQ